MSITFQKWSQKEDTRLMELFTSGHPFKQIGKSMGKSELATRIRYSILMEKGRTLLTIFPDISLEPIKTYYHDGYY